MNREGKSYRHKKLDAIVLVVKSRPMSNSTWRHTVVCLDPGKTNKPVGAQTEADEVPHAPWRKDWEEEV